MSRTPFIIFSAVLFVAVLAVFTFLPTFHNDPTPEPTVSADWQLPHKLKTPTPVPTATLPPIVTATATIPATTVPEPTPTHTPTPTPPEPTSTAQPTPTMASAGLNIDSEEKAAELLVRDGAAERVEDIICTFGPDFQQDDTSTPVRVFFCYASDLHGLRAPGGNYFVVSISVEAFVPYPRLFLGDYAYASPPVTSDQQPSSQSQPPVTQDQPADTSQPSQEYQSPAEQPQDNYQPPAQDYTQPEPQQEQPAPPPVDEGSGCDNCNQPQEDVPDPQVPEDTAPELPDE